MASKKLKLEEKGSHISLKFERASDEENTNLDHIVADPLDYDLDSSLVTYCEGDSNDCPDQQNDIKQNRADDLNENSKSKDQILRATMYKIVVEKNVSTEVTESFLTMLFNYGIRVPLTKTALINEFQTINDETISKQYTDLKKQMNKMEDTLEQLKHAVLKIKGTVGGPMHEIRVNIPIQTEQDLELLEHECAENDLTANFMKFKYLSDIIEDHVLLQYNWDGVQKKKKLSDFTHLHQTLYSAFENETMSDFPSYRNFVKAELRRIHNRHHQKLSRKRRSLINCKTTE